MKKREKERCSWFCALIDDQLRSGCNFSMLFLRSSSSYPTVRLLFRSLDVGKTASVCCYVLIGNFSLFNEDYRCLVFQVVV
ncbi:unnamed protein product [Cuscuta campestris]|uniref:Uncharacterized protein n=1 Tax=Cuscuta campestris TaxID=132261 RepID=A0A484LXP7_9ASTE|nr:unnamed protein product [Cuscuta campestris]